MKILITVNVYTVCRNDLIKRNLYKTFNRPDSSVGRVSAFGAGGRGFESRPHHTKGVKNGNSSFLADTRIKGVVLGR